MVDEHYLIPGTIDGALEALAAAARQPATDPHGGITVVAGGTDVYPALVGRDLPRRVLDISAVAGLRGISRTSDHLRIGAATTWHDLASGALPEELRALAQAAGLVGAIQVQHAGTIAGNLCTASPAGDGIPALIALDATVELRSAKTVRTLPVAEFVTGYRSTARRADELVTAVLIPDATGQRASSFVKLGTRAYLVISLAMVAASVVRNDNGDIIAARVAVGACSPVARRLTAVEQRVIEADSPIEVTAADLAGLSPIDDIRCSADYRLQVVPRLVERALAECGVPGVEVR